MSKVLPLNEMSIEEKLRTMESLWDDLVSNADTVASPEWHKEVLSDRENGLSKGDEKLLDWNAAKNKIKKALE